MVKSFETKFLAVQNSYCYDDLLPLPLGLLVGPMGWGMLSEAQVGCLNLDYCLS